MKKKSWVVTLECVVKKEIITSDCTEEQAKSDPYKYIVDERELGQMDYEVLSIEPNN